MSFICTERPPSSSRSTGIASPSTFVRTGGRPIGRTALSPRPMPRTMRPGCIWASVPKPLAVTVRWRVKGLVTAEPNTIRSVAASPRVAYT